MVGILVSFWDGLFSGAMLVFRGVGPLPKKNHLVWNHHLFWRILIWEINTHIIIEVNVQFWLGRVWVKESPVCFFKINRQIHIFLRDPSCPKYHSLYIFPASPNKWLQHLRTAQAAWRFREPTKTQGVSNVSPPLVPVALETHACQPATPEGRRWQLLFRMLGGWATTQLKHIKNG